jgi:ferredoxin-NADP reductase
VPLQLQCGDVKVRVDEVRTEALGVVSLRLIAESAVDLPAWEAGAHIDVHLPSGLIRQYSLCGDEADRKAYRIAVLLEPAGRGGSEEVHTAVRAGDVLTISAPRNNFRLEPAGSYVFIAGGIGITPILPMVRAAARQGIPWRLVYGGRTSGSLALTEEIGAVPGGSVAYVHQDVDGLPDLAQIVGAVPVDGAIYCCGPPGLIDAVVESARSFRPELPVRFERFSALPVDTSGDEAIEVRLARTGSTVLVPPGTSLLRAVRDAGVEVESSCEEGTCGTCEAVVLEGVPDHRDVVLSETERAANDVMMLCVSRSCSRLLVLDL